MTVSATHIIWAYDVHIADLYENEGKTVAEIRAWLRDDRHINVSEDSIRDVLRSYSLLPPKRSRSA